MASIVSPVRVVRSVGNWPELGSDMPKGGDLGQSKLRAKHHQLRDNQRLTPLAGTLTQAAQPRRSGREVVDVPDHFCGDAGWPSSDVLHGLYQPASGSYGWTARWQRYRILCGSLPSMASRPESEHKPALLAATYAVVLFSIIVQGSPLGMVARRTVDISGKRHDASAPP